MRNRQVPLLSWVLSTLLAAGFAVSQADAQTTTGGTTTGTTGGTNTSGSTGSVLSTGGAGTNLGGGGGGSGATGGNASGVEGSFATSGATTSGRTGAFNTKAGGSSTSYQSLTNPTSPSATATGIPSTTNPLRTAYGNPYVVGAPIASNTAFGQPLYGKATTTNTTAAQAAANSTSQGFNALGVTRVPSYATVLSEDFPRVSHPASEIRTKVESAIMNSSFIQNKQAINIKVQDQIVTLTGQVGTEKERRIAEGMIRLTPGVQEVHNELQVLNAAAPQSRSDN